MEIRTFFCSDLSHSYLAVQNAATIAAKFAKKMFELIRSKQWAVSWLSTSFFLACLIALGTVCFHVHVPKAEYVSC